jgi:hypothetical protein
MPVVNIEFVFGAVEVMIERGITVDVLDLETGILGHDSHCGLGRQEEVARGVDSPPVSLKLFKLRGCDIGEPQHDDSVRSE